jgi:hypothetical protein
MPLRATQIVARARDVNSIGVEIHTSPKNHCRGEHSRREVFLERMAALMPWQRMAEKIARDDATAMADGRPGEGIRDMVVEQLPGDDRRALWRARHPTGAKVVRQAQARV